MTRPWCLRRRRKRRSPRTSLSSKCSTMVVGGGASGSQLASGIAGGWPLPVGPRLAILSGGLHGSSAAGQGDDATMVLLGWCLVRQWIHVPASAYCGGAFFSSSSEWWILLLFTETGTHSVKLCKVVDNPVMAQRTLDLVPCSRPQRFPSCSLLILWSSWLCRSCSSGTRCEETVEVPQLQPVFLDLVDRTPVVRNDSSAATFAQWKCPRFSFHR